MSVVQKPPNAGGNVLSDGDKNDTPVIAAVRQIFRSTAAEIPLAKVQIGSLHTNAWKVKAYKDRPESLRALSLVENV